jgi:Cu/Ag efflux protein CusF
MTTRSAAVASLVAAILWAAAAGEPGKPVCVSEPTPQHSKGVTAGKTGGEVVKVDTAHGKVTIRQPDGKSHEYFASQQILRDLKEGDRLEVTLRQPRSC